ncbi:hypothetical protein [Bdellovibrio reynosensis]|uniref:Polysaccharide chain length determinant N-terminal domain-containing protein n=1 Tax=Bdellovibrio reynosensis TaxID=2835041 RepID=A0ABY4CBM8_9BACT|nr:hypothetical protein [Bdellovibrio reynosensis]UOF01844.1 hypothetical protein MNR06_02610 [Bdellovibrio reynosensis]
MKQFFVKHKTTVLTTLAFVLVALIYSLVTPKVYQSSSRAVVFRMKLESPDGATEESRNRWIWVRDGLSISSALVSDEMLKKFLEENEPAKAAVQGFKSLGSQMNFLRRMVKIQYTGGDENNYIIEVKSSNQELALDLNKYVFNNLRFLVIEKDQKDYEALLAKVQAEASGNNAGEKAYFQDKLVKLKFEHLVNQAQKENLFQTISEPAVSDRPVWPKPLALVVVALLAGVVFGYLLEFLLFYFKNQR